MKIVKENHKNTVTFKNVPRGAVFKDEEGTIYMRLDSPCKSAPAVQYDSVILENGKLIFFSNRNEEVEVLEDAVLTY